MLGVLEGDTRLWATDARRLLQEHVVPKRDVVLRVSEQVQALNRSAFVQQQVSTAEAYRLTQRSVWRQLGVAVGISLAIALMATVYAGRLERHLRVQRGRDAQNTRDLERLSAKLINAQEEERRNIARELHDEVGQALMAVKVELAVAQRTIEANGASGQALIEVREIADGALQTVRTPPYSTTWGCGPPSSGMRAASRSVRTWPSQSSMRVWEHDWRHKSSRLPIELSRKL
jgi:signal transduction histidine kinase